MSEIRERLQMCEDVIRDNPYSHPVTTAWYYEDVSALRDALEAVAGEQDWKRTASTAGARVRELERQLTSLREALEAVVIESCDDTVSGSSARLVTRTAYNAAVKALAAAGDQQEHSE